jgi:predicted nucleic acid-binding protein
MILADTGPLIALFDPADGDHVHCVDRLKTITEPLTTTVPVLTEAFHLLDPGSRGATALMQFIVGGGLNVWFLDDGRMRRAFELMRRYADRPMDLADASLVIAAETLGIRKVFTLDRADFRTYRIKRGYRSLAFEILGDR